MKRQPNGVNFDEGIALETREELELLFVDARPEELHRLVDWFRSDEREGLLLGGQIGVGKSTLLNALMFREGCKPDVLLRFDRETPSFGPGGFWAYALGRLVQVALKHGVAIPDGFALSDFPEAEHGDWPGVAGLLTQLPRSVAESDRLNAVHSRIAEEVELAERQCRAILTAMENKAGRPLRLFCGGVDKFAPGAADTQSLAAVLNLLSDFKTVFEVNALHLFGGTSKWQRAPRLFVSPFEQAEVIELLRRRLGTFEAGRRDVLPAIARFSGGNARQALRLLTAYDYARGAKRLSLEDAFGHACRRVRADFLYLSFDAVPANVLTAVARDGFVRAGLIAEGAVLMPAGKAIYENWLILKGTPDEGDRWPSTLNPLLQPAHLVTDSLPESPEMAAIKRWAERHDVSPYGLDFDISRKSSVEVWNEINSSAPPMDNSNIVQLLDAIAGALFSVDRRDRVLIAFRDSSAMQTARDYFAGKAGEMGFFPFVPVDLETTPPNARLATLLGALRDDEGRAIYSILLPQSPEKALLRELDHRRDVFVPYEMLWWVRLEDLSRCLQEWSQLRQLMSVYILEDELLGSLSPEEVKADLDYLALLEKDEALREAERRLQHVLNVVRERRTR